jgi:hypothetical protein
MTGKDKDETLKLVQGDRFFKVHPHPGPLPSRERGLKLRPSINFRLRLRLRRTSRTNGLKDESLKRVQGDKTFRFPMKAFGNDKY